MTILRPLFLLREIQGNKRRNDDVGADDPVRPRLYHGMRGYGSYVPRFGVNAKIDEPPCIFKQFLRQ